ncbi:MULTISPECIES: hypothetical protein [unclassified Rhizobium]|uniref:hypothetical protein n=1 Tax=unclassified Rhizobium TaxID=2613769 RepID=UPI000A4BE92E|nr:MULTISPECIES: hypothetical protein [unclassified Rhizobium]
MNNDAPTYPRTLIATVAAGCVLLLAGAAFAGWIVQGPEMFLAMAENGLSWCF